MFYYPLENTDHLTSMISFHSTSRINIWAWARSKPGISNSLWVFFMDDGDTRPCRFHLLPPMVHTLGNGMSTRLGLESK